LALKRYDQAERLLRAGYEGMKRQAQAIPTESQVRLRQAGERLVRLYEAMGKKDEAARWRQDVQAVPPKL
jgi:hypothetical protein